MPVVVSLRPVVVVASTWFVTGKPISVPDEFTSIVCTSRSTAFAVLATELGKLTVMDPPLGTAAIPARSAHEPVDDVVEPGGV